MTEPALSIQVGGNHYKTMPVQPVEFALVNELKTAQANIVKYCARAPYKGGAEDLQKAAHYCDLWVELVETYRLDWSLFESAGRISVETFVAANRLPDSVQAILRLVCIAPSPVRVASAKILILEMRAALAAQR